MGCSGDWYRNSGTIINSFLFRFYCVHFSHNEGCPVVPIDYEKQNVFYSLNTIQISGCVGCEKEVLYLHRSMSLMRSVLSLYRGHAMGSHSLLPLGCAANVLDQVRRTLTGTSNAPFPDVCLTSAFVCWTLLYSPDM